MSTFVFINRFQGVNMGNWHIWKNQHGQLTQMLSSTKNRSLIDAQWHLTLLFPLTIIWNTMYGTNYCQTADALQILKGLWKSAHYKHILAWLFFSDWVVAPSSLGTGPSLVGVWVCSIFLTGDPVIGTCGSTAVFSPLYTHTEFTRKQQKKGTSILTQFQY